MHKFCVNMRSGKQGKIGQRMKKKGLEVEFAALNVGGIASSTGKKTNG